MLELRNVRRDLTGGQARLCADVSLSGRGTALWFSLPEAQASWLCPDRGDAFVMALLPMAMRGGHDLHCDAPVSERLHYQLETMLIPTLASCGALYREISIHAPLTAEPLPRAGAVGTGFSAGADSLYTVLTHGPGSDYPLTHLAIFNVGVFEGSASRRGFRRTCDAARPFAQSQGLDLVALDSNLHEALPERFLDVYSFRNLAGALALQGLFSVYLLSSGHEAAAFSFDLHNSASFDLLSVPCARTESLAVYLAGAEVKRWEKLAALADWTPAHTWLHPCFQTPMGNRNCGRCKKCARDMTTLYALGVLDRFGAVYDLADYHRCLPQRLGFVLANRDNHLYDEPLQLLEERGIPLPPAAIACGAQFRKALDRLEGEGRP